MSYFLRNGSKFQVTNEADIQISKTLPVGTYSLQMTPTGQYYFQTVDAMKVEGKVYGEAKPRADRIINTFNDRPLSTGVLLEGEKGSGKTFLAKILSKKLTEMGVITIIVNSPFQGESFNELMQNVDQPAMIFFDEFEKIYSDKQQQGLLTLFDGTYSSKKMFVVAINDSYRISDMFKNRPGRFFYRFTYKGLDEMFIREYCEDNLNNKAEIPNVMNYATAFTSFNFDMLKALVEEMNRYKEGVQEVAQFINATPNNSLGIFEVIDFKMIGKKTKIKKFDQKVNGGSMINPFSGQLYVTYQDDKNPFKNHFYFQSDTLSSVEDGIFTYLSDTHEVRLRKYIRPRTDYMKLFVRETADDFDQADNEPYFDEDDDDDEVGETSSEAAIDMGN